MAVKRSRKSKSKSTADIYEQTMLAEGAPLALDLLGLGSSISDLITGKPRKAKTRRAKKKARAKVGRPASRKAGKKVGRPASRKAGKKKRGRPPLSRAGKKSARKARRKTRRA